MLKEQMNRFKDIFKNDDGNNKKKIENLVVFIIILIITIIGINIILNDGKKDGEIENTLTTKTLAQTNNINSKTQTNEDTLKSELEDILSKIDGVGETKVLITYSQTSQLVALYNEDNTTNDTEENDSRWWK